MENHFVRDLIDVRALKQPYFHNLGVEQVPPTMKQTAVDQNDGSFRCHSNAF